MRQDMDALPTDKRRQIQAQLWAQSVRRAWEKSAFYQKKLAGAGFALPQLTDLEQIARLPFTDRKSVV